MSLYDDMLKSMQGALKASPGARGGFAPVKAPAPKPPKPVSAVTPFSPPAPPRGAHLNQADELSRRKQAMLDVEESEPLEDLGPPEPTSPGPSRKERDIELWKAWKAAPGPSTLKPLMAALDPVIQSEVNRWAANAPRYALEQRGRQLTLEALQTYDPSRGAALNTHVTHRLRKLSREVYSHADPVRLPENKQLMVISLNRAAKELEAETGLPPSTTELAGHLGWSPSKVKSVRAQSIDSYVESQDSGAGLFVEAEREADDPRVTFYVMGLNPQDRIIFEHVTGWNDAEVLPVHRIATKLRMTPSQVNTRKARMVRELEALL